MNNPMIALHRYLNKGFILILILAFIFSSLPQIPAQAQDIRLPTPGIMVHLSPEFNPPILKGIKVHPDNSFRFDFILDKGDGQPADMASAVSPSKEPLNVKATQRNKANEEQELKQEANKLIKYFLASLTLPEKDLWVNLSPYEKDRIIPNNFGLTEMGRDLLAQDYMLKQITASLIYPEDEIGKRFWKRIYEEAQSKYHTTNIPVNTFNKVWIVPAKAVVYENAKAGTAYVVESKLKVMLEQDYLAISKNINSSTLTLPTRGREGSNDTAALGSQIVREIVLPELEKEINQGKNFAQLRQVYNSLILATWYKKKIKDSILAKVYADKNKIAGLSSTRGHLPAGRQVFTGTTENVSPSTQPSKQSSEGESDPEETTDVERIYHQYLQAFKKGVYNYIKEEVDPITQQTIPRKYFSGGVNFARGDTALGLGDMMQQATSSEAKQAVEVLISNHAMKIVVDAKPMEDRRKYVDERPNVNDFAVDGSLDSSMLSTEDWPETYKDNPFFIPLDKGASVPIMNMYQLDRIMGTLRGLFVPEDLVEIDRLSVKQGPFSGFIKFLEGNRDKEYDPSNEMSGYLSRPRAKIKEFLNQFPGKQLNDLNGQDRASLLQLYQFEFWIYQVSQYFIRIKMNMHQLNHKRNNVGFSMQLLQEKVKDPNLKKKVNLLLEHWKMITAVDDDFIRNVRPKGVGEYEIYFLQMNLYLNRFFDQLKEFYEYWSVHKDSLFETPDVSNKIQIANRNAPLLISLIDQIVKEGRERLDLIHKSSSSLDEIILRSIQHASWLHLNIQLYGLEKTQDDLYLLDAFKVTEVLENLILNAHQAGATEITISVDQIERNQRNYVEIKVRDNGTGIDPGNLSGIFQQEFSTKATGQGLGLALSRQIIRNHGELSDITFTNNEGISNKGATFTVLLLADKAMDMALNVDAKTQAKILEHVNKRLDQLWKDFTSVDIETRKKAAQAIADVKSWSLVPGVRNKDELMVLFRTLINEIVQNFMDPQYIENDSNAGINRQNARNAIIFSLRELLRYSEDSTREIKGIFTELRILINQRLNVEAAKWQVDQKKSWLQYRQDENVSLSTDAKQFKSPLSFFEWLRLYGEAVRKEKLKSNHYTIESIRIILDKDSLSRKLILERIDESKDQEMQAQSKTGGIDLTSDKALQVQNSREEIKFNFDSAMLTRFQNALGFYPVIIGMEQLPAGQVGIDELKGFFGIDDTSNFNVDRTSKSGKMTAVI